MKPGTFTQLYIHLIFAPKYRDRLLTKEIRILLNKYLSGILNNRGHKSIIVNGYLDHIHIFLGLNPKESISELVAALKRESSRFLNEMNFYRGKFHWQDGYAAFSYSRSQINKVYNYIQNQETHHKKKTFREEYMDFMNKYGVEFKEEYLFEFFDIKE